VSTVDSGLTAAHLTAAVPELTEQIRGLAGWQVLAEAERAADVIACGADILWAGKVKRTAEVKPDQVRHALAAGIAILAGRTGGVTFGGLHWCTSGHPDGEQCPGPGEWALPDRAANRSARGAFFTPRDLAEEVTGPALEDLVYEPGPRHIGDREAWRLVSSVRLLNLTIGDIAVGSGVFLLAACRFLADRLVEAWFAEADQAVPQLPPYNPMTLAARRLATRCLYGADIDPTSVELARLSLALLTPSTPVDLTRQIVCGDSLLGISSLDMLAKVYPDFELLRLVQQVEAHLARVRT
jgi:hypothetical protein